MKAIIGLGNPGFKYERTRHNVGFWAIDNAAQRLGVVVDRAKFQSLIGEARIAGEPVLLVKPQTYMNVSGVAAAEIVRFYKLDVEQDILVIYDDMDFPPGQLKLRARGSAGGHNGVKSLIQSLGTDTFCRIRIGIGRPPRGSDIIPYVLGTFPEEERVRVEKAAAAAAEAAMHAVEHGFEHAMNQYNRVSF
ncbi:peptidyl-tRNA hydrolase [Alicyclobacillus hesperidum URH17-3-68]|uniref:Peptidyl-tRNA hydrolase n=1 Tax=Alicyclobacillus hesperidum TaxID=89784 RepID=A0AA37U1K6_9BACL|nr:aminoacyl-tRNA hydrolase [Alicyclobacillus hesperidum]EJY56923.1 peptidyl-tRNA hydrolase [Alicyclobacillus hesperidum URH17-3-68]GLV13908.1 peptidyl-tRNA hydrolase [Alicyclobacillus hesperidum]